MGKSGSWLVITCLDSNACYEVQEDQLGLVSRKSNYCFS